MIQIPRPPSRYLVLLKNLLHQNSTQTACHSHITFLLSVDAGCHLAVSFAPVCRINQICSHSSHRRRLQIILCLLLATPIIISHSPLDDDRLCERNTDRDKRTTESSPTEKDFYVINVKLLSSNPNESMNHRCLMLWLKSS
jgi:hypothetical protein